MTPRRAILLLRISDDKGGEAAGVARQEHDGRMLAERLGWTIGPDDTHVIIENDTSAFKRRKIRLPDGSYALRTVRPGFRRGLDMLTDGDADGLLAYDLDRVARDPRDLEDLIDVVETRRDRIPVESVSGSLRLANDADVTMARVMVAVANKSSRDTARRVSRKHEELAEEGRPGGGGIRAYGYEKDGVTIREPEAEIVRTMAAWVLEGRTLTGIAKELNARQVQPVRSAQWGSRSVWSVLTGARVAGLRRFRGEVVGEAAWPAILDRDEWEAVRAVISDRARGHTSRLQRWLSGSLWCALSQNGMTGVSASKFHRTRYWCATTRGGCGKISIDAAGAEEEISSRIVAYLADPRVIGSLSAVASDASAEQLRADIADDETQLKELARMWAAKHITMAEYTEARTVIKDRLQGSRALVSGRGPGVLRRLLEGDPGRGWEALDEPDKRDVLMALVPDGFEVHPHPKGAPRRFLPERIQVRRPR